MYQKKKKKRIIISNLSQKIFPIKTNFQFLCQNNEKLSTLEREHQSKNSTKRRRKADHYFLWSWRSFTTHKWGGQLSLMMDEVMAAIRHQSKTNPGTYHCVTPSQISGFHKQCHFDKWSWIILPCFRVSTNLFVLKKKQ